MICLHLHLIEQVLPLAYTTSFSAVYAVFSPKLRTLHWYLQVGPASWFMTITNCDSSKFSHKCMAYVVQAQA